MKKDRLMKRFAKQIFTPLALATAIFASGTATAQQNNDTLFSAKEIAYLEREIAKAEDKYKSGLLNDAEGVFRYARLLMALGYNMEAVPVLRNAASLGSDAGQIELAKTYARLFTDGEISDCGIFEAEVTKAITLGMLKDIELLKVGICYRDSAENKMKPHCDIAPGETYTLPDDVKADVRKSRMALIKIPAGAKSYEAADGLVAIFQFTPTTFKYLCDPY
jgi:hypothetical protein